MCSFCFKMFSLMHLGTLAWWSRVYFNVKIFDESIKCCRGESVGRPRRVPQYWHPYCDEYIIFREGLLALSPWTYRNWDLLPPSANVEQWFDIWYTPSVYLFTTRACIGFQVLALSTVLCINNSIDVNIEVP